MAGFFGELALQYVLSDAREEAAKAAEAAAAKIEESTNRRAMVGQWVASINRWISQDEGSDDDYVARGKAYDFLADTLQNLKSDTLRADQIKLLVNFFCGLFSSDHKAGVSGSSKALNRLFTMKFFQHTLSYDIIQSVTRLGDDFQRQLPATRLQLYTLFLGFLQNPDIVSDLEYRDGNTCGFMTQFMEMCRNERDPENLMIWFDTLATFMHQFNPSTDVTAEVFKTFSPYFPISMRASVTPTGITAADLKQAVRACFSSHYRLSSHTIPFLINKLDQGEAVTVAVKVDILQTLEACLREYGHPKQSIVPYIDTIWNSLKYEVRNGEINDAIEGTLKSISALTKKLNDEDLKTFFSTAWLDLSDDLAAPKYSSSAGQLIVAIAGATGPAFVLTSSKALTLAQSNLRQTKSTSHQRDLLTLIYSLLLVRSHLVADTIQTQEFTGKLNDESFGDSLFSSIYEPLWQEVQDGQQNAIEKTGLLTKLMEGMSALVDQQSSDPDPKRLCNESTCQKIFQWISEPAIICPLDGRLFLESSGKDTNKGIRDSAVASLKKAIPRYPEGYQQLLKQFLSSLQTSWKNPLCKADLVSETRVVASALCEIGCSENTDYTLPNAIILVRFLMQTLRWLMSARAHPRYWAALIVSIHLAIRQTLETLKKSATNSPDNLSITEDWYALCSQDLEDDGAPPVESGNGHGLATNEVIANGAQPCQSFLAYCVGVLRQLYRRFTAPHERSGNLPVPRWAIGTSQDISGDDRLLMNQQDIVLHHLGALAASIVRALTVEEQKSLRLDEEVFVLFHGDNQTSDGTFFRDDVLNSKVEISPVQAYRTAPLSMGILQGLYAEAIRYEYHASAMESLCIMLTSAPSPCSDSTRAALDAIFATLSNKFTVKGEDRKQKRAELQQSLIHKFEEIWKADEGSVVEPSTAIRIFRSILHILAGDVARFQGNPADNGLLQLVCANAPYDRKMGRQLAQNFEVLVSPKESLEAENHAVLKRLSQQWIYNQTVAPFLVACFPPKDGDPNSKDFDEQSIVNRAIASLSIVKYLKYEHYASDVDQVLRVCIRSLSTFEIGPEMKSCLEVLHTILDKDPGAAKEHTRSLVMGIANVYKAGLQQARAGRIGQTEHACRHLALSFLAKLPTSLAANATDGAADTQLHRHLAPHGRAVAGLATLACGDPVREIRRGAPVLRTMWEKVVV